MELQAPLMPLARSMASFNKEAGRCTGAPVSGYEAQNDKYFTVEQCEAACSGDVNCAAFQFKQLEIKSKTYNSCAKVFPHNGKRISGDGREDRTEYVYPSYRATHTNCYVKLG